MGSDLEALSTRPDCQVSRLDPDDAETMAACHAMSVAALARDLPDFPPPCPVRYAGEMRYPGPGMTGLAWFARVGGELAGTGQLGLHQGDNLSTGGVSLQVHPAHRRRGVGRALLAAAVDAAREDGRKRLTGQSVEAIPGGPARDEAGTLFARAVGADAALTEVRRRLDVRMANLSATGPVPDGYSVVCWRDRAPDRYIDDIATLDSRLLLDAPIGNLAIEPHRADAARRREQERINEVLGVRSYHAGVRHDATGRLVAWTALGFEATIPDHAWQWITIVHPDHRGHGLGLLTKAENLRYACRREPALRTVDTWNAAANRHMIAINERLGYRPVDAWSQWQLELD